PREGEVREAPGEDRDDREGDREVREAAPGAAQLRLVAQLRQALLVMTDVLTDLCHWPPRFVVCGSVVRHNPHLGSVPLASAAGNPPRSPASEISIAPPAAFTAPSQPGGRRAERPGPSRRSVPRHSILSSWRTSICTRRRKTLARSRKRPRGGTSGAEATALGEIHPSGGAHVIGTAPDGQSSPPDSQRAADAAAW